MLNIINFNDDYINVNDISHIKRCEEIPYCIKIYLKTRDANNYPICIQENYDDYDELNDNFELLMKKIAVGDIK